MKRLFALRENNGNIFIQIPKANGPLCFATKAEAKERRDEINKAKLGYTVTVTLGADHRNFKGY